MTDDFTMREATDFTIKVVVTGYNYAAPVTVSAGTIEATFYDVNSTTPSPHPEIIKDNVTAGSDIITVTTNPLSNDSTLCTINIPILDDDVDKLPAGKYRYEVSAELGAAPNAKRQVVYPLIGNTATFTVVSSDTWETIGVWPDTRAGSST